MKFAKTKLAAAIAAATMATAANAVVVVGGDNGWTVSFDGNVNAFYSHFTGDKTRVSATVNGVAQAAGTTIGAQKVVTVNSIDASRIHSGFLPAFFSFSVKSPTVNGLTGKGRFSFAPAIQTGQNPGQFGGGNSVGTSAGLVGANIDTREVLGAVDGSFGEISFGRTLSIFGRQAILHDMTLFGVGQVGTGSFQFGSVGAGRIGLGYLYPDFEARFAWASPAVNGFKLEVGAFDPFKPANQAIASTSVSPWETNSPRFEGELTYATTFTGGNLLLWADGMYQKIDAKGAPTVIDDITIDGVGGGAEVNWNNFALTGYYQRDEGTGLGVFKVGGVATGLGTGALGGSLAGAGGSLGGINIDCGLINGAAKASCREADQDEWYVQGAYTFGGKTKVAFSYGKAEQDKKTLTLTGAGVPTDHPFQDIDNRMFSVGVYHDMTAWLKLVAEYNNIDAETKASINNTLGTTPFAGCTAGSICNTKIKTGYDSFSVGAFVTW